MPGLPALVVLAILLAACGKPLSYQLRRQILIPPPPAAGPEGEIKNARRRPMTRTGCDIQGELVRLRWRGDTAEVGLRPESYFPLPGDQHPAEIAPRSYLDPMRELESFRDALLDREGRGCLTDRERLNLTRALTERFALPPIVAYSLRFGAFAQAGFIDLVPDFRLKVVSPANGGYNIAYCALISSQKDDRVRIVGEAKGVAFPESAGYYRLLFWTSVSSGNHYSTLLSADDRPALRAATERFQAEPDGSCKVRLGPRVKCIAVPPDVAVNPEMRVTVNGSDQFVPLGGALREIVDTGHRGVPAPATLQVRRLYRGRLIPVQFDPRDVLGFVPLPGDRISW